MSGQSQGQGQILIEIQSLAGITKQFSVDIDLPISDLVADIVREHPAFAKISQDLDWLGTKLIYNGKTLDPQKTLEDYTEFQIKPRGTHKFHLIVKTLNHPSLPPPPSLHHHIPEGACASPASPIHIKGIDSPIETHVMSRSFPGASYMRKNSHSKLPPPLPQDTQMKISESLANLANYLTNSEPHHDKLDQILQVLQEINSKLN